LTTKANAHFVDCDISGMSGLDDWESNNYKYPDAIVTPGKIGIGTAEELQKISWDDDYPRDGDYELTADIDCSSIDWWKPIGGRHPDNGGYNTFIGTFDGRNYTISNVNVKTIATYNPLNKYSDYGLFGRVDGVTIENVILENADYVFANISHGSGAGLLVGYCVTESVNIIRKCSVSGSITGVDTVGIWRSGGIVGSASSGTTISLCHTDCDFTSGTTALNTNCGGIVGITSGAATIENCYATGTITGTVGKRLRECGGLAGDLTANITITNCYSAMTFAGTVYEDVGGFIGEGNSKGIFSDCFWDGDVQGDGFNLDDVGDDGDVDGVTKGTSGDGGANDMYKETTFTNWDFLNIWEIEEDVSYPTLLWLSQPPTKIKTGEQHRTTAMPTDYSHLNGQTVQGLGDGSYLGTEVVSGGAVDMDDDTTINHIGLQYTSTILPMKIDGEVNIKRISKIIPNVYESVGGDYGRDSDNMYSMVLRDLNDPLDTDSDLFSGHVELPYDGTYDRSGDMYIKQIYPLPYHLLGMGVDLSQEAI